MASGYKYVKAHSILGPDEYNLTRDEYYCIYSFYVTYSMCNSQSNKKRSLVDYGWVDNTWKDVVEQQLLTAFAYDSAHCVNKSDFDLKSSFTSMQLEDGLLANVDDERFVIAKTSEQNKWLKLFHRLRDGFAHGKFCLRYSSAGEKMVVIQDDDGNVVTARIVLKLSTVLAIISTIDMSHLISP